MAKVTLSLVKPCGMCFGRTRLGSVIVFEAQRGNWNRMRLSNFFLSKVWNISYRSKHKISDNLHEQVEKCATVGLENQSKLIDKVSALMENEKSAEEIKKDLELACKRFPAIKLGYAPPVELYSNLKSSKQTKRSPSTTLGESPPVELYSKSKSSKETKSILKTPIENSSLSPPVELLGKSKSSEETKSILKTPTENSSHPPPVELLGKSKSSEDTKSILKTPTEKSSVEWFNPEDISGTISTFFPELLNGCSSNLREEKPDGSSLASQTATSEIENISPELLKVDSSNLREEKSDGSSLVGQTVTSETETISDDFAAHRIPGLTKSLSAQLERSAEEIKKDLELACKRFPAIKLGYAAPVELYSNLKSSKETKSFPSTTLGESPPVELLGKSKSSEETKSILKTPIENSSLPPPVELDGKSKSSEETMSILKMPTENSSLPPPNYVGWGWFNPDDFSGTLSTFFPELLNVGSSNLREEKPDGSSLEGQTVTSEIETISSELLKVDSSNLREEKSDGSSLTGQTATSEIETVSDDFAAQRFLDGAIGSMPGLTKRHSNQLNSCGVDTMKKLLHHFPRTYVDLQNAQSDIEDGQYLIFVGKILSSRGIKASSSFAFLEVVVSCEVDRTPDKGARTIFLHLKKFFGGTRFTCQPFLNSIQQKHTPGDLVCVSGKVKSLSAEDRFEMNDYNIYVIKDEEDSSFRTQGRPYPIYPSKGGLTPKFLSDVISRALRALPANMDPLPKEITTDFGLPSLRDAYVGIHEPKNLDEADLARKRLIFDEFFYLQLARLHQMLQGLGTNLERDELLKEFKKPVLNAAYIEEWSSLTKSFLKALPYSLTPSQLSAVSEIIWDLKRPVPMNRLLQGDVGCGKTVVAFLACMEVIGSGYQAAFMAPTELLAIQHYEQLRELIENMKGVPSKPTIGLLTGSTPLKQLRMIRQDLQSGAISIIIGTHCLFNEKIEYSALRIAVVDEQQRFGVIQRGKFNSKLYGSSDSDGTSKADLTMAPHVLAMSATPIPRSLALALYGDISLTQITGMPIGRIPVETHIFEGNQTGFKEVYSMMLKELRSGGRVYVVYPVIDKSRQLPQLRAASADLEIISKKFPNYSCGLLHGKMKSGVKEEVLKKFRSGETHILLSTQVIEIGVDVPEASMMVVMNAERFGVAQLHQLRGRVGRGTRKSKCLLIGSTPNSLERLKMLGKSSDGFHLANIDLLLRGPGDLLGKKQSGHLPEFPLARLEIDGNMLQETHLAALKVLGDSHDLEKFPAIKAELSMRQPLSLLGD